MKHIDEPRLESDVAYRYEYLAEFIGFDEEDVETLHNAAAIVGPLVPQLVDGVYQKLFSYDATKRHFLPRQAGYTGSLPDDLESLEQDHEMIQFRKKHLARYLEMLVTRPYNARMVEYLDLVGKMHTPQAGSAELDVPLVQMNALMGFVADVLMQVIHSAGLDPETELRTQRAFQKLLWIQNDLISRHRVNDRSTISQGQPESSLAN